jgi:hypothetical protein
MDAREYLCRKRKRDSSDCSRIEWNGMECICNCKQLQPAILGVE